MEFGSDFNPPIREIIVFKPESFPLYRWDNSSPSAPPNHKVKRDDSLSDSASSDLLPKLPFRKSTAKNKGDATTITTTTNKLNGSLTSMTSTNTDDTSPRCPGRSSSPPPSKRVSPCGPSFLSSQAVGPCRRPPSRTQGFNQALDLHQIPLKPLSFGEGKHDRKLQHGFAQVLQDVVMDRCPGTPSDNNVHVVFAIRRPGCGQCREHGMQLAHLVADDARNPNVTLTGVLKETKGIQSSIRDFYSNYFTFPLYLDEGWDLYHTIGNKKLSVFKMCARGPALEVRYAKKGIRNIPLGGDLFTQGGVLIFDKTGKLKFVYYETFGKPLDMEAIKWAIDHANE